MKGISGDSDPVTKGYLKDYLKEQFELHEAREDLKREAFERKIEDKFAEFRSEALEKFDKIAGMFQMIHHELTVGLHQHDEQLDDHEKRIKKLEEN